MEQPIVYRCAAVDDNPRCLQRLSEILEGFPGLKLIASYTDPVVALREISVAQLTLDFLFLDIDMPGLSGLDLAAAIRHKVEHLIIITAHAAHSLKAYDVRCTQYLLKPYSVSDFQVVMDRVFASKEIPKHRDPGFVFVKGANGHQIKLSLNDLIAVAAMEHYTILVTANSRYIIHTPMREVENSLAHDPNFFRVHKSHLISKRHVQSVVANKIVMSTGLEIPVGATYKDRFNSFLASNSL